MLSTYKIEQIFVQLYDEKSPKKYKRKYDQLIESDDFSKR